MKFQENLPRDFRGDVVQRCRLTDGRMDRQMDDDRWMTDGK